MSMNDINISDLSACGYQPTRHITFRARSPALHSPPKLRDCPASTDRQRMTRGLRNRPCGADVDQ